LKAGDAKGGDIRGKQSAAITVVKRLKNLKRNSIL